MSDRRRSRLLVLSALAGVLVLGGCGSQAPRAAPRASPTPSAAPAPPAPPRADRCYRMSLTQAIAPTSSAKLTACSSAHTTQTYYVGTFDSVVGGHLLAVDSDRVSAEVATACRERLPSFLGGTPAQTRLSMARPVWFTPTVRQSDEGATWFRCDAVVVADRSSLASRSGTLRDALRKPTARKTLAMCGTAAPGTKAFHRVLCSAQHSWRALAVVEVKGRSYPGVKAAKAAGHPRCEDAASSAAKDPLSYQYSYEWPTAADWAMDQHYGICWLKGA